MELQEQIELILTEANAYGFKNEVIEWAQKFMDEGYGEYEAYSLAFDEWIK